MKRHDILGCGLAAVVAGGLGLASFPVQAQSRYPERPIRLIVPFAPGGTIDAYARALARQVESQIGQPIVVDNRSGANGILGADTVAKATPDGYTLLDNAASFVINASMYKKLPYDTEKDFAPITNFVKGLGYLLVVHPSVPANSVTELIDLAKRKPDSMRFSSPGIVNRLYAEIRKAIQEPKLVEFFRSGGFEPQGDPPAEFQKAFRNDIKRYAEIVRAAKINPE